MDEIFLPIKKSVIRVNHVTNENKLYRNVE